MKPYGKAFCVFAVITIRFNKHRPALYRSRLDKFIENTRKGIMYGDYNDNGKLLDY